MPPGCSPSAACNSPHGCRGSRRRRRPAPDVAYIEESAELRRVVGGDPVVGWFPRGGTKSEEDSVRYVLRVPGTDGSATVRVDLIQVDRAWRVVGASYRTGAGVAGDLPAEDAEKLAAAQAHAVRGCPLYQNGRLREALEAFDQAVGLDLANEVTLHRRAWVLHDLGGLRRAADDAARAVVLDTLYGEAHFALGVMLGRLGEHEAAAHHFDRAVALLDDPTGAGHGRGVARVKMGEIKAGTEDIERDCKPGYEQAFQARGRLPGASGTGKATEGSKL